MLPEKVKKYSLKYWHVIVIVIISAIAISSETSNAIFGNEQLFLKITEDRAPKEENPVRIWDYEFLNILETKSFCANSQPILCIRLDAYLKWLIAALLAFCAFRYWSIDIKNQELIDIYKQIFELRTDNPDEEIDKVLSFIAERKLKFTDSDRISVYKFNAEYDCFFRVGRYCPNPELAGGGQKKYEKQGAILSSWNNELGISCTEFIVSPHTDIQQSNRMSLREYKDDLDQKGIGGISQSRLRNMRMLSRSYYAFTLKEPNSLNKTAVIVFESRRPKAFKKSALMKVINSDSGTILKFLVVKRNLNLAENVGIQ